MTKPVRGPLPSAPGPVRHDLEQPCPHCGALFVGSQEAARRLGVSRERVQSLLREKRLSRILVASDGGMKMQAVSVKSVENLLAERAQERIKADQYRTEVLRGLRG